MTEPSRPPGSAEVFVSYRRDDSADIVGRILDRLTDRFGDEAIFRDIDDIELGTDFRKRISDAVGSAVVLLAVIGPDWLSAKDAAGHPRLADPDDYVRIEIEAALERDIAVVPLFVRNASEPSADQLPTSLQPLAVRNGLHVRQDPDFDIDVGRLVAALERHRVGAASTAADPKSRGSLPAPAGRSPRVRAASGLATWITRNPVLAGIGVAVAAIIAVGAMVLVGRIGTSNPEPSEQGLTLEDVAVLDDDKVDIVLTNHSDEALILPDATYRVIEYVELTEPTAISDCSSYLGVEQEFTIALPQAETPLPAPETIRVSERLEPGANTRLQFDFGRDPPGCTGTALLHLVEVEFGRSTADAAAGAQPLIVGPLLLSASGWRPTAAYFEPCVDVGEALCSDALEEAHITNAKKLLGALEEAAASQTAVERHRGAAEVVVGQQP